MKAQSLKNAILQLAVQGKLVTQNEQDESAQILLEKIKVEKAQLVKDKKIKAEKALTPITDEEKPFDIPDRWNWVRLGDIVYNWGQKNPDVNFYYIDVGSINSTIGCVGDCSIIEPQNAPSRARKLVKDGTVIYSTVRPYLLNIAIVDNKDGKELIASTAFAIMHPLEGVYNKYLFYYLRSRTFVDYVNSQMIGVAYPAINDQKLFYGIMPLPPLVEQYRIVEKIEQLMPLVELYNRYEQELSALEVKFPQDLKKSVLQYAVQGKLVAQNELDEPASELLEKIRNEKAQLIKDKKIRAEKPLLPITNEEKPFDIPDTWEWVRLGELLSVKGGKRIPKGKSFSETVTPYIYIRVADMKNNTIVWDSIKYIDESVYSAIKNYTISKEDLYLTIAGTIGNIGVVPDEFDNMNLTENAVKLCNILISKEVLLHFICSEYIQNQFVDKTNKVAQPKLAIERILTTVIPLPPLAEQKRIVEKVERLLAFCDTLTDENKLKQYHLPKQIEKVIAFPVVGADDEHLVAARADEINAETRIKEAERLEMLKRSRK